MNYVRIFGLAILLMVAFIALLYAYRANNPAPGGGPYGAGSAQVMMI